LSFNSWQAQRFSLNPYDTSYFFVDHEDLAIAVSPALNGDDVKPAVREAQIRQTSVASAYLTEHFGIVTQPFMLHFKVVRRFRLERPCRQRGLAIAQLRQLSQPNW
jgi:hypothetical protein